MIERVGRFRRVSSCWVFVVLIGSLGMLAVIPFIHAAVRLRRRSLWLLAAVYLAVDVVMWGLIITAAHGPDDAPVSGTLAMTWFGVLLLVLTAGVLQLSQLRREILGDAAGPIGMAGARIGLTARHPVAHCTLLSVDVERSGDALRDSEAFVRFRRVLFRELRDAVEASRIRWKLCLRQDTGDGMILIVPAKVPKSRLIHPLLDRLAAGLRQHNRLAAAAVRIRVRVAVHAGDVRMDEYGITGRPKVLLARLLAAQQLRAALSAAPTTATVAAIVSDSFYDDVICQGYEGIDPELYTPVTVRVKEAEVRAWLHIPGHARLMVD